MWLCDIGNTHVALMHCETKEVRYIKTAHFKAALYTQTVYFISVNERITNALLAYDNYINIEEYVNVKGTYDTLGVDRKLLAWYVKEGIVIDAGSAITVDKISNGVYEGGFISLGMFHMQKALSQLSLALDYSFNFELSLDTMAKNTQDAITYGALAPLVSHLQTLCKDTAVVCTGGDGAFFSHHLNCEYNPYLIFDAMHELLQQKDILPC